VTAFVSFFFSESVGNITLIESISPHPSLFYGRQRIVKPMWGHLSQELGSSSEGVNLENRKCSVYMRLTPCLKVL